MFSPIVTGFWWPRGVVARPGQVCVIVDEALSANRSASLIRIDDGPDILSVTPTRAAQLELSDRHSVNAEELSARLNDAGITMNDPDNVFYLPDGLEFSNDSGDTRQLTERDTAVFADLAAHTPADDWDEAYVELDHWLVFGTFVEGQLVAAASMYPWAGQRLADLGVITLPAFRGRGLGRLTVRAISDAARTRGYEPQYRCQLDNTGSVALAGSAGFVRFGQWEVIIDS